MKSVISKKLRCAREVMLLDFKIATAKRVAYDPGIEQPSP